MLSFLSQQQIFIGQISCQMWESKGKQEGKGEGEGEGEGEARAILKVSEVQVTFT